MVIKEIVRYPDQRLNQPCLPVHAIDTGIRNLVRDLIDTALYHGAAGLSAPQIGSAERVMVVVPDPFSNLEMPKEFINPELLLKGGSRTDVEGCLSIPGVFEGVKRPVFCVATGHSVEGDEFRMKASGDFARAIFHELDHLNGTLFWDRLSHPQKTDLMEQFSQPKGWISKIPFLNPRGT